MLTIFTVFFLGTVSLFSSDTTIVKYAQFSTEIGQCWVHDARLKSIINNPISGFSIGIGKQLNGSEPWHKAYNYPYVGVDFNFYNFGNRKIIGYSIGVSPYISFPFIKQRKFNFNFRVSPGLNIMTKTYDATINPNNIAISSPINALIVLGIENTIVLSDKFDFFWGVNMVHISNATLKKPNMGLNSSTIKLGLRLNNQDKLPNFTAKGASEFNKKNSLNFLTGFAVKEIKYPGGEKYGVAFCSSEYQYALTPFTSAGGTLDVYYDQSTAVLADEMGIDYNRKAELLKIGVAVTTQLKLQRLSIIGHLGVYTYNIVNEGHIFYQRIGIRYLATQLISFHLGLKTHLNVADHFECGIAFEIF